MPPLKKMKKLRGPTPPPQAIAIAAADEDNGMIPQQDQKVDTNNAAEAAAEAEAEEAKQEETIKVKIETNEASQVEEMQKDEIKYIPSQDETKATASDSCKDDDAMEEDEYTAVAPPPPPKTSTSLGTLPSSSSPPYSKISLEGFRFCDPMEYYPNGGSNNMKKVICIYCDAAHIKANPNGPPYNEGFRSRSADLERHRLQCVHRKLALGNSNGTAHENNTTTTVSTNASVASSNHTPTTTTTPMKRRRYRKRKSLESNTNINNNSSSSSSNHQKTTTTTIEHPPRVAVSESTTSNINSTDDDNNNINNNSNSNSQDGRDDLAARSHRALLDMLQTLRQQTFVASPLVSPPPLPYKTLRERVAQAEEELGIMPPSPPTTTNEQGGNNNNSTMTLKDRVDRMEAQLFPSSSEKNGNDDTQQGSSPPNMALGKRVTRIEAELGLFAPHPSDVESRLAQVEQRVRQLEQEVLGIHVV